MIKVAYNPKVTFKLIREVVCGAFDVSEIAFRSNNTKTDVCNARYISWLLAHYMTETPLKVVGMQLGGRNASAVSHGINSLTERMQKDRALVLKLIDLVRIINECAEINHQTFKSRIQDPDPKAIALKALSHPNGDLKISRDDLLAVLRFAAIAPPLMPVFFDSHAQTQEQDDQAHG